jgi:threonine dehydrogenase-like Zn-dependent dehydrogenase
MRAFALTGPRTWRLEEVPDPTPGRGEALIEIHRVGLCGTDVELFTGEMAYYAQGHTSYPLQIGHEWSGTVIDVGNGVDTGWLGQRVSGDTMIGCGNCERCRTRRWHVCDRRYEIGVRTGKPGAMAQLHVMPIGSLHLLPHSVDDAAGALAEPGGNAVRCVDAAGLRPGQDLCVIGTGTIGLLIGMLARARGITVHLVAQDVANLSFPRSLGFDQVHTWQTLPTRSFPAVIDASTAPEVPALILDLVEPGGRVVYIGLAEVPSPIDSRILVFADLTAVSILGAGYGLPDAIAAFASGAVDPRSLVAATIGMDQVGAVLGGWRPPDAGPGPKILVNPQT